MKKYLNQTTVNVIAIATAAAWGLCLAGNFVNKGPDKAMKQQLLVTLNGWFLLSNSRFM